MLSAPRFVVVLLSSLLLAWSVWADEVSRPDGTSSTTQNIIRATPTCAHNCATTPTCHLYLDDDPDDGGDDETIGATNIGFGGWEMEDPSEAPTTDADAQELRVLVSQMDSGCNENAGSPKPLGVSLWIYCSVSETWIEQIIFDDAINAPYVDVLYTGNWTFPGAPDCEVDGSDVVIVTYADKETDPIRYTGWEALEWQVDTTPSGSGSFTTTTN